MSPIVPVILSGGSGTRLWPMSTSERPKQMLPLTADQTMLQLTAMRAVGDRFEAPIVVANARHVEMIDAQLAAVGCRPQAVILEPLGRNTAPAIALAALCASDAAAPLLVMPSDHVIHDVDAFHAAIEAARPLVEEGWLVTFGITPDSPETGYGYIKVGEMVADRVHRVDRFVEKPPRDAAEAMLESGDHVWNGGIFLFRADAYLDALARFEPAMLDAVRRSVADGERSGSYTRPAALAFSEAPNQSIDYAVMEKSDQVAVVPVTMGWNDVGSWDALHSISARDDSENAIRGEVIALDSTNCLVRSDGARIAMVGVKDLIVVASGNDILILPRGRSQEVKSLLDAMQNRA
ncbi:mannose-1-phosphate guanylyltransferase/mannose-6-phosphate isomerase [Sphingomonas sp.]|jgi:mannose-1-phosphate guanylyltransferase/mannose-1-phosphate guanylyltransferase/mannose-6-phosphate isomerase|uniref:mannose-1-phosphate guanylyltransferase/mannose-6-phosphate isomerase n=1 Tax=Sphingomonas sp. TaxID=28214 RepID=UPI002610118A|nr:mannose-1-phosphate guanylyltransferase/mannose-6-phosphate isomerase [Sphingomonas sp.]MDF2493508.1 mannose-phosphate guanylyltransferase/mannose-6-phosphate isomerase [Sphingomonas sp.]